MTGVALGFLIACAPEGPPPAGDEELAPGWVLSRPAPEVRALLGVHVLASFRAYAVGTDGAILRYDRGEWAKEPLPDGVEGAPDLEAVSGVRDEETGEELVVAVGDRGTVLIRRDGVWQSLASGVDVRLFGVWVRAFDDAFIVGDAGTILRFDGDALSLMEEESLQERTQMGENGEPVVETYPIPEPLKAVAGTSPSSVWAVGARGAVYFFDGARWRRENAGTSRPLTHVFAERGVWATASDGVLLHRRGSGAWDAADYRLPTPLYLQGVWASSDEDVFAVGMAGSIFQRSEGKWQEHVLKEETYLRAIHGVLLKEPTKTTGPVRVVIAVGAGGRVVRGPDAVVLDAAGDADTEGE